MEVFVDFPGSMEFRIIQYLWLVGVAEFVKVRNLRNYLHRSNMVCLKSICQIAIYWVKQLN